jgi:hypothetical protein
MRRTMPPCTLVAAFTVALVATPALAQVSTVPDTTNKFVKTLQFFGDQGPLVNETLLVVPANRNFRVTDLVVYARGASNCLVTFSGKTAEFFVKTGTMEKFQFASGPTYGPGEAVVLGNNARVTGGGNNCTMTYTVMGYTFRAQ